MSQFILGCIAGFCATVLFEIGILIIAVASVDKNQKK